MLEILFNEIESEADAAQKTDSFFKLLLNNKPKVLTLSHIENAKFYLGKNYNKSSIDFNCSCNYCNLHKEYISLRMKVRRLEKEISESCYSSSKSNLKYILNNIFFRLSFVKKQKDILEKSCLEV